MKWKDRMCQRDNNHSTSLQKHQANNRSSLINKGLAVTDTQTPDPN